MTDHNTDTHTTNEGETYFSVYFLAAIILMLTGKLYGPEVLFWIGAGLLLLPFLIVMAHDFIVWAITEPVMGAIMAFAGVNITMIAVYCPYGLFLVAFLGFPGSCCFAVLIVFLLYSIGQLCQTSYYQRKAVVREAVVVHRFTTEENNNNNNNSASSRVNYYWVGEYEAPSSPRYVTPNNGDEKRTTSIQLFHNNGNQQQGAVEKNGLEECSCTEEEEEEVCYKIQQQQRFHKKFLVTGDLYDAASLEVSVLPGRPNSAMLTKSFKHSPLELMYNSCFYFVCVVALFMPGVVVPLQVIFEDRKDQNDLDYGQMLCSEPQTSLLSYITLVVMVMLAVSNMVWNGNLQP